MKPIVKIIILVLLVFAMCIFAVKKSIDYSFKKAESSETTASVELTF